MTITTIGSAAVVRGPSDGLVIRVARRSLGAAVAFGIAGTVSIVGLWAGAWYLAAGIPAATLLGWALAPRIRNDRGSGDTVLLMGGLTVLLTDAFVIIAAEVGSVVRGTAQSEIGFADNPIISIVAAWVLGLLFFGWAALIITIPAAWAWASLVRLLVRRGIGATSEG